MTCPVGALSTDPERAQEEQEEGLGGVRRIIDIIIYHYNYHTKEKEEDQVGKEKG